LAPNPELWRAFDYGPGLRSVLDDFYTRAFGDELLAPFFASVDKQWVIGKQYSFLSDIFSGGRSYFGARPRNAHHWMVIDDDLFDYREAVMEDCLRRHGLAEHLIAQFRAVDEVFRKQIVKDTPRPMRVDGQDLPLDGHEHMTAPIDMVCDGCSGEIPTGVWGYHEIHTGQFFCEECHGQVRGASLHE
jgi:truncated hemoglobin YjbI